MKIIPFRTATATAVASLLALNAFAQGSLTPPGSPAPTMKTLDQIEARTPIGAIGGSTATLTISVPGSYVLMGNVTVASGDGIVIQAENVALDLNGFTISSTMILPASGSGILIGSGADIGTHRDVTVRNGFIRGGTIPGGVAFQGYGFANGVCVGSETPSVRNLNLRVTDVMVSGVFSAGINLLGPNSTAEGVVVERCSVLIAPDVGIRATNVFDSTAANCGNLGIDATVARNCTGTVIWSNGRGVMAAQAIGCRGTAPDGIGVLGTETAVDCSGYSVSGTGLQAATAINCYGQTSSGIFGMDVAGTATNCRGSNSSGAAINAFIAIGCTSSSGGITASHKYNMP